MTRKYQNEVQEIEQLEAETLQAIFKGQRKKVADLYEKAEHLFAGGSSYARALITNKFIAPLSQLLEMNYSWGKEYLDLFPRQLKAEYCRQIYSSGI